ncbi:hypothetical protein [Rhodoferax sp.]|uniref:hypothetical protein n=1 Tax=Rhodoferax sp. TaxID=50421 RepID=UPI00274EC1AF|nr:hypothetical protein [Rhodoferax sp.]
MRSLALATLLAVLNTNADALERDVRNGLEYVGGIYGSILAHEVGHALTAKAFDATDIRIKIPREGIFDGVTTFNHPRGLSSEQGQVFSIAGLVSANVIGELVIQRKGLHRSPFSRSLVGTALVSNVIHVVSYYTKVRGRKGYQGNDIDAFELSGGNPHMLSAGLLAYTAWSLSRASKKQIPLFGVQVQF